MIAVLADDISGATELAAVAYDHGLTTEVLTRLNPEPAGHRPADLIAVDTGSRSLPPEAAAEQVADVAKKLRSFAPEWIYKKTDSVCRGNITVEIRAIMAAFGLQRAILIPANPGKSRAIRDGRYAIDGVPLNETLFATDPEYPALSSAVTDLLGAEIHAVRETPSQPTGISVPDAWDTAHLARRARECDSGTLPAGGADFFAQLLQQRTRRSPQPKPSPPHLGTRLFVCGTCSGWAARREEARQHGVPIAEMPRPLFLAPDSTGTGNALDDLEAWAGQVATLARTHSRVLMAVGHEPSETADPTRFAQALAAGLRQVLRQTSFDTLLVEGGATAALVCHSFGWNRLRVERLLCPGIPLLTPVNHAPARLAIKPGSYPWPANAWNP